MIGSRHWIAAVAALLGLGTIVSHAAALGDEWRVTVRGGETVLGETPVVTEISGVPTGAYQLQAESGDAPIFAQVFAQGEKQFLAFVLSAPAGARAASFSLKPHALQDASAAKGVSFRPHGANLEVELDQKLLTEYRVDAGSKPTFFHWWARRATLTRVPTPRWRFPARTTIIPINVRAGSRSGS